MNSLQDDQNVDRDMKNGRSTYMGRMNTSPTAPIAIATASTSIEAINSAQFSCSATHRVLCYSLVN